MGKGNKMSARGKKAAARKRADLGKKFKIAAIIGIPVLVIALVIVVAIVGKKASVIDVDYSAGLDDNGLIAGVSVNDYVQLCDFSNIVVPKDEVVMDDSEWNTHVSTILKDNDLDELTDEFVAEKFGEHAKTVAEYETYIRNLAEEENTKAYVLEYILDNSTVTSMPDKYYKLVEENWDAQYMAEYNYYNGMYYQFLGYYNWNSHLDYYDMSKAEYKEMVKASAEDAVKQTLVLQAAYEKLGLSLTDEDLNNAIVEAGYEIEDIDSAVEDYGMPYWKQFAISYKVVETATASATIE